MNYLKLKARRSYIVIWFFALLAQPANSVLATVIGFEELSSGDAILNYYNGGSSSGGNGPGPDSGIEFSSSAMTISNGEEMGMVITPGASTIMDVESGFESGLSFDFMPSYSPFLWTAISIYDEVGANGKVIGEIYLRSTSTFGTTTDGTGLSPFSGYAPSQPLGVEFEGVARSIQFSIIGASGAVLDNITLGSATPGSPQIDSSALPVPEPMSSLFCLAGVVYMAGASLNRRNARASSR